MDRISALSILEQTRRQFHQPLLIMLIAAIAYVDLKVAFDTVDRKLSSQLLKEISLSEKIVSILAEWLVSPSVGCGPGAYLTWTEGAIVHQTELLKQIKFVLKCSNKKINKSKISALIFLRQ